LALLAGAADAFVPSPEQAALEVSLPYQQGKLVYGDAVAALSVPRRAASIEEGFGGQWSVHSWNRQAQTPHYILGSGADVAPPFQQPGDAVAVALQVMERNAAVLGVDPERLRTGVVTDGAGKVAVHFQQTYEGLDVLGGRAHATFLNTGRVFALGADFFRLDGLNVTPNVSQAQAERIAIDDLPHRERSLSSKREEETGLYVLPYPTSLESVEPHLVWRVNVETDGRSGLWVTHVDAHTGSILWRYNDVHYIDYLGNIAGDAEPTTWCNGAQSEPMKYMEISVEGGGGTTTTNGAGNWTIPNGDETTRAVSARFFGPFVDVNRATGGSDPFLSAFATPGVPVALSWTDINSRQDERDVFDAVVDMHDFFESIDPGYSFAHQRMTANVGVPGSCNAFWNGSINFYNTGPGCGAAGCANTGEIQSVVHHEYGHGVQNHLIGGQGDEGCGEGNADVLANFMTDESIIGRGFCLSNCSGGIRNSSNTLQYPEDLTGEEHDDGRIIAGVLWSARVNLIASLGFDAGKAHAATIWHFGRKLERPSNQPDQCLSLFIADDDNGNLLDGTPHFDDICQAVIAHDENGDAFDCPDPGSVWVDFTHTGSEDGTQAHPFNSFFQAHGAAPVDYVLKVRSGTSNEVGTLSKRGEVRARGGAVRVGGP
jgi:hypothetical protein